MDERNMRPTRADVNEKLAAAGMRPGSIEAAARQAETVAVKASLLQQHTAWITIANARLVDISCALHGAADRIQGPVPRESPQEGLRGPQASDCFDASMEAQRAAMMHILNELELAVQRFNHIA